jgi:hypothetical protein
MATNTDDSTNNDYFKTESFGFQHFGIKKALHRILRNTDAEDELVKRQGRGKPWSTKHEPGQKLGEHFMQFLSNALPRLSPEDEDCLCDEHENMTELFQKW